MTTETLEQMRRLLVRLHEVPYHSDAYYQIVEELEALLDPA